MYDINLLIKTALTHYDNNRTKYKNFFEKIEYKKIVLANNDIDHNEVVFYDKNKKEIFKSKYEVLGVYYPFYNLWAWGWSLPTMPKNTIQLSKKLLLYGLDLDVSNVLQRHLRVELSLSRFKVVDKTQIDIHIALGSYLTKKPIVYEFNYYPIESSKSKDGIFYIVLFDDPLTKKES